MKKQVVYFQHNNPAKESVSHVRINFDSPIVYIEKIYFNGINLDKSDPYHLVVSLEHARRGYELVARNLDDIIGE